MWIFTCLNCLLFPTPRLLIALPSSPAARYGDLRSTKMWRDNYCWVSSLASSPLHPHTTWLCLHIGTQIEQRVYLQLLHSHTWAAVSLHSCKLVLLPSCKSSAPARASRALTSQNVSISFFFSSVTWLFLANLARLRKNAHICRHYEILKVLLSSHARNKTNQRV